MKDSWSLFITVFLETKGKVCMLFGNVVSLNKLSVLESKIRISFSYSTLIRVCNDSTIIDSVMLSYRNRL